MSEQLKVLKESGVDAQVQFVRHTHTHRRAAVQTQVASVLRAERLSLSAGVEGLQVASSAGLTTANHLLRRSPLP